REKLAADFPQLPNYRKEVAHHLGMLGDLLKAKPAEAVKCYQQAVDIRRKLATEYPKDPSYAKDLAGMLAQLGMNLLRQQKPFDAEPILRECLAIRHKHEPDAWTTFNTKSMLGGALLGQKKYPEADPLLLQGYDGMK